MEGSRFCGNAIYWSCFISGQAESCYQTETSEVLRAEASRQVSSDWGRKCTSATVTEGQRMELSKRKIRLESDYTSPGLEFSFWEDKGHHLPFARPGPLSPESPLGCRDPDGPAHLIESTALLLWAVILAPTWWNKQFRTRWKQITCLYGGWTWGFLTTPTIYLALLTCFNKTQSERFWSFHVLGFKLAMRYVCAQSCPPLLQPRGL